MKSVKAYMYGGKPKKKYKTGGSVKSKRAIKSSKSGGLLSPPKRGLLNR